MEKKYNALRTIGTIYKVLGGLAGIVTILIVLSFCATSVFGGAFDILSSSRRGMGMGGLGVLGGIFASLAALIYGGGAAVTLYALGEGVYLLIDLEENTRATNLLLRRQQKAIEEKPENDLQ